MQKICVFLLDQSDAKLNDTIREVVTRVFPRFFQAVFLFLFLVIIDSKRYVYLMFFFLIDCVDYLGSFFKRLKENAHGAETISVVGSHFLPGLTF